VCAAHSQLQTLFQLELDFDSPTGQQFLDRIHFDGIEDPPEPEPEPEPEEGAEGEDEAPEPEPEPAPEKPLKATRPDVPRADFFNELSREYIEELVEIINLSREE
jgi:hypothetical protein